jgi:hypothetical protein
MGQKIDLSIKAGAAKLLAAPLSAREGYAYVITVPPSPYPLLFLEANKKNLFHRTNAIAGIGLLPTFSHVSINPHNIKNGSGIEAALTIYALQLHLGVERMLGRDGQRVNKNIFSIIGAIGFNLTGNISDSMDLMDSGNTQNNEPFQGTKVTFQHSAFFGPTLIGGSRYHIMNRKGNEVFAIEMLLNYNLTKYFHYHFSYTINNSPTSELIPEKGFSLQLMFIKRLFWIKR